MLGVGFGTWLIFLLGILLGFLLGNKEGRVKFFKGFRSFLGQIGRGARGKDTQRNDDRQAQQSNRERSEVHHYEHTEMKCPICKGTGEVDPPQQKGLDFAAMPRGKVTCKNCRGEGWVWT